MQNVALIIIVFFLLLLAIPIFTKGYFCYDALNNLGVITIYVFFIKILCYKFKLTKNELVLFTQKKKKQVEFKVSKKQIRFLKQFTVQMQNKVAINNIAFNSRLGINDAMNTALLSGLFNIVCNSIMGILTTKKGKINYSITNYQNFNGMSLVVSVQLSFFIALIDILYAIIMSFLIIKRSDKYEKV